MIDLKRRRLVRNLLLVAVLIGTATLLTACEVNFYELGQGGRRDHARDHRLAQGVPPGIFVRFRRPVLLHPDVAHHHRFGRGLA